MAAIRPIPSPAQEDGKHEGKALPAIEPWATFPTIKPEVFLFAASVAMVRGWQDADSSAPPMKRTLTRDADGKYYGEVSVDDRAVEKLWETVAPHFRRDEQRFRVFLFRWFALMRLGGSSRIGDWITTDGDGPLLLKDAVLRVAARFPLNERYEFDEESFFAEVAREHEEI